MKVTATNGKIKFELKAKIHDDIMKLESTSKTKAFGVPEFMTLSYNGSFLKTYRAKCWNVTLIK